MHRPAWKLPNAVGWNADAIEAQAFAYLAVRSLRGLPITFPTTTGVLSTDDGSYWSSRVSDKARKSRKSQGFFAFRFHVKIFL